MEEILDKLMLAMLDKQQAKGYDHQNAKCILIHIREYLNEHVENSFKRKTLLTIMFSNILILCANEGVTSEELMNFIQLDFENDNHKTLPSKINFEYDHKLFTASCAAMTGILASQSAKDIQNEDVITYMAVNQAKGLLDALNK